MFLRRKTGCDCPVVGTRGLKFDCDGVIMGNLVQPLIRRGEK